jgi:hypothetical protein
MALRNKVIFSDENNNVGIGEAATSGYRLLVKDTATNSVPLRLIGTNNYNYDFSSLSNGVTNGTRLDMSVGSAAGEFSFTNSGGELVRIKSDGKVGVGCLTPLSDLHVTNTGGQNGTLRVGGNTAALGIEISYDQSGSTVGTIYNNPTYTSTAQLLKIGADGDANPNQLVLKGDGKVGIGHSSPAATLHVEYQASTPLAIFDEMLLTSTNTSQGTFGSQRWGWYGTAWSRNASSCAAGWGSGFTGGNGDFGVHTVNNTCAQNTDMNSTNLRFVVKNDGKVGIGTGAPAARFEALEDSSGNVDVMKVSNYDNTAGTGQSVGLAFGLARNSGTQFSGGIIRVGREQDFTAADTNIDTFMSFYLQQNYSCAEKMRVTSAGNVSVNNTYNTAFMNTATAGRYIGVASNNSDALFIAHASGQGVGYFGYDYSDDRLIIATDNGAGGNSIQFSVNAGATSTGAFDNLASATAVMKIDSAGAVAITPDCMCDANPLGTLCLDITGSTNPQNGGLVMNSTSQTHIRFLSSGNLCWQWRHWNPTTEDKFSVYSWKRTCEMFSIQGSNAYFGNFGHITSCAPIYIANTLDPYFINSGGNKCINYYWYCTAACTGGCFAQTHLMVRYDSDATNVCCITPNLTLYNASETEGTSSTLAFAGKEAGGGNSVGMAFISARKEASAAGSWAQSSLNFLLNCDGCMSWLMCMTMHGGVCAINCLVAPSIQMTNSNCILCLAGAGTVGAYLQGTADCSTHYWGIDGSWKAQINSTGGFCAANCVVAPYVLGTCVCGSTCVFSPCGCFADITAADGVVTCSTRMYRYDDRCVCASGYTAGHLYFGFGSYDNDNASSWADWLLLSSYTDSSGGNINFLTINRNGFGMRLYQRGWANTTTPSSTAFGTDNYVEMIHSANISSYVTGTTINNNADNRVITGSGSADTLNGESALTFDGTTLIVGAGGSGNADINGTIKAELVVAPADSLHDLGTTSTRWANAYVDDIVVTNGITIGAGGITGLISNETNNRIITSAGGGLLNGEANLIFDGNNLCATNGYIKVSGNPSAGVISTNGNGSIGGLTANGLFMYGKGSTYDVALANAGTNVALAIPTGTTNICITNTLNVGSDITATGDITSTSDCRVKSDINSIDCAIFIVNSLCGRRYIKDNKTAVGVIAQEVEKVLPEVVHSGESESDMKSVSYGNITAVLIEAIKEQQKEILRKELDFLKSSKEE